LNNYSDEIARPTGRIADSPALSDLCLAFGQSRRGVSDVAIEAVICADARRQAEAGRGGELVRLGH
jgi:hypothetical protein